MKKDLKDVKLGDLSITTTYVGDFAGDYICAAMYACPTLANGIFTIKDNIAFQRVVKKVAMSGGIVDFACDFSSSATITLTERLLKPKQLMLNKEICKQEMSLDWESVGYGINDSLPPKFQDFIITKFGEMVEQQTEKNIWQGSGATTGEFWGMIYLASVDTTTKIVSGVTVASTTIMAELGKIVDQIGTALYGSPDLVIALAGDMYRAYIRSLGGYIAAGVGGSGTQTAGSQWYSMGAQLTFEGIPVVLAPGLNAGCGFCFERSNVWFGTDKFSDKNVIKVLDMSELDGSDNIRVVMRYSQAIQYGIGSEIVFYASPAVLAAILPASRT